MFQTQKGLGNPYGDDTIDIKALLGRFLKRWYFFVIGVALCGSFGAYKLYTAEKVFRVKAKAILGNPHEEELSNEKNLPWVALLSNKSSMEDKIGVMTSYNLIREAVRELPVEVSYFSKEPLRTREVFLGAPFQVKIDSSHAQLVWMDIFVTRIGQEVKLRAKTDKVWLYDLSKDLGVRELENFVIDETLPIKSVEIELEGERETVEMVEVSNDLLKFTLMYDRAWQTYPDKEYYFRINTADGLTAMFQESIQVSVAGEGSNIINITTEGPIVDLQKLFINELLEAYKRRELLEMKALGMKTVSYLDSLIRDLSGEIDVTRQAITSNSQQGIDAGQTDVALRNALTELETSYGEMEAQLRYYKGIEAKLAATSLDDPLELPTSSVGKSDPGIAALITNLSIYQTERAQLLVSNNRGPKWQVNEINIQNTRNAIKANVQSSIEGSEILMDNQLKQINEIRGRIGMLPREKSRFDDLTEQKTIKTDQLTVLKDRKLDAELAVQNAKVDIQIIESARMDGNAPIKPKKPLIMLISVFLGLVIPLGVILARDFFDNRIASHQDIQASTNMPVLGFVARHDRNSNYIVPKDSRTALAESFRSIRIKMQYLNDNVHQQVIGVTSSSSGEGKTFCVTNIAAVMAQAGKKTLLIDMDLRRPRVTRYFDNPEGLGLSNYLAGEVEDAKSIVAATHIENLYVIHSGPVVTNPLDLIATDRMTHLMEAFREEFDHVVIDAPPVGLVSDYLVIMKMTDFNIYVVRDSSTTVDSLKMINELYDSQKIRNIAMLINDVKSVSAYGYLDKHYGYGD